MAARETVRLDDQLCFALYAATNALTRAYRPLLAEIGLTYPQYLIMMVLWQDSPIAVRGLAARLQLGASAVTPLIDRLERAGLVERRRDDADHRSVLVALTEDGARLAASATLAQHSVVCRTGLSDDALQQLRRELHRLVDRMTNVQEHRLPSAEGPIPEVEPTPV